ncbi:MAG: NADH:flavin oxidoreductase [Acidimicrobiia bacterium]
MSGREAMMQVRRLRTPADFKAYLSELGVELPFNDTLSVGEASPLGQPLALWGGTTAANRFCILPMEGWDGTTDGRPTELVERRWLRFAESGAAIVWAEATAVRDDARANPNQLALTAATAGPLAALRERTARSHRDRFGRDLVLGLQLTHSGRWCRPDEAPTPLVAYRHPVLDRRHEPMPHVLTDAELGSLVSDYAEAARLAQEAGFAFVDVKHCHGYLLHELLSGVNRDGPYGGDFEGRTRFVREVVAAIAVSAPGLPVAVRLSAYDFVPFRGGEFGVGEPDDHPVPYRFAFGGDETGVGLDLDEPSRFLALLESLGVSLVCITAGSPYYSPHIQRPAWFPPSDGYRPPEDPLVGVARLIAAAAELKRRHPRLAFVGSGYSYLQEWLPNVAQAAVRLGLTDAVGLGRMALSYHDLPTDVLAGAALDRRRICRTFSDCTTAPRNGLVSGCWPLDDFYKSMPERRQLAAAKRAAGVRSDEAGQRD